MKKAVRPIHPLENPKLKSPSAGLPVRVATCLKSLESDELATCRTETKTSLCDGQLRPLFRGQHIDGKKESFDARINTSSIRRNRRIPKKDPTMKRIALTLAATALAWFGTTTESSAHSSCRSSSSTYLNSYTRCGCPVYVQRYIAYYDHCGCPVWQTRVLPVNHHCRDNRPAPCHNDGGYAYRGGCEQPTYSHYYNGPRQWGHVVFQAHW